MAKKEGFEVLSWKRVVVLVLLFLLGALLVFSYVSFTRSRSLVSSHSIPMVVKISPYWGFAPENMTQSGLLNFSQMVPGMTYVEGISIKNSDDFSVRVEIRALGNITRFLHVGDNFFVISPHDSRFVNVSLTVWPMSMNQSIEEAGVYEGELKVLLFKA